MSDDWSYRFSGRLVLFAEAATHFLAQLDALDDPETEGDD